MLHLIILWIGLSAGLILNLLIDRQVAGRSTSGAPAHPRLWRWIPLVGAVRRKDAVAFVVELLCATMALVLLGRSGFDLRSVLLFVAALVLIDVGAIDFKLRLIDTLVLVVGILVVVALAPWITSSWLASIAGLIVGAMLFWGLFVVAKLLFPKVAVPFGLGDVYLAAFIGALVGVQDLSAALMYGMVLAGVVAFGMILARGLGRRPPTYLAYGTYLCLGTLFFLATASM